MSNSKQSDVEKEQFWQLVLEEHANSQMSVRAFCRQESLSEPSFYSWRRKLHARDLPPKAQACGLIPVNVVGPQPQDVSMGRHTIEIVASADILVRLQDDCSTETIGRVLTALRQHQGELAPC